MFTMINFFLQKGYGWLLIILLTASSCNYVLNVTSKSEYLNNYRKLIQEVQNNYHNFNEVHWERYDKELNNFSQTLYVHFIDDLSYQEKLEVGKYPIMYHLAKYKNTIATQVDDTYKKDVELLQESLTEIVDSTKNIYTNFESETKRVINESKLEGNFHNRQ